MIPNEPTLAGRKVVVVRWRDGSELYVANIGPAYPLRAELKGRHPALLEFRDYGAPLHINAPHHAIDLSRAGY